MNNNIEIDEKTIVIAGAPLTYEMIGRPMKYWWNGKEKICPAGVIVTYCGDIKFFWTQTQSLGQVLSNWAKKWNDEHESVFPRAEIYDYFYSLCKCGREPVAPPIRHDIL